MKSKLNKIIMNPWTVTLGSGLIVLVITVGIDIVSAEKVFSTIKKVLNAIWNLLRSILNFEIKVWWILIGFAVLILALWIWSKHLDSKKSVSTSPKFLEYTQDTILEYKWKWIWEKNYIGKYSIEQLHPICSHCDTPLIDNPSGYGGRYTCLRCKNGTNLPMPDFDHVKMMISDNVRRRYFLND